MTNFERTSSDDNLFEKYDTPINIIDFGKIVFKNFKKCTAEDIKIYDNEIIVSIKGVINEQRVSFRKFIRSSIKFSNEMADFSIDILSFADSFKDNKFSNEEILKLLNDLLEKSRKKNDRLKSLKNIIAEEINEEIVNEPENIDCMVELDRILDDENIGMKEKLIQICNFLTKYIEDLAPPSRKSEFITFRMMLNKIFKFLIMNPIFTIFFIGFTPEVLIVLFCLFGPVLGLGAMTRRSRRRQVGLTEKMNQYCESLGSIVEEIGKFETFWDGQTQIIEYLIENLEGLLSEGENARIRRYQIVNRIVQRWKDVRSECKLYYIKMKAELDWDRLTV